MSTSVTPKTTPALLGWVFRADLLQVKGRGEGEAHTTKTVVLEVSRRPDLSLPSRKSAWKFARGGSVCCLVFLYAGTVFRRRGFHTDMDLNINAVR